MVTKTMTVFDALDGVMAAISPVTAEKLLFTDAVKPVVKVVLTTCASFPAEVQVPSPRQNVDADALVPLFKLATGTLPVLVRFLLASVKTGLEAVKPVMVSVVVDTSGVVIPVVPFRVMVMGYSKAMGCFLG